MEDDGLNLQPLTVKFSDGGVPEETGMEKVLSDLRALKKLYGLLQRVRTNQISFFHSKTLSRHTTRTVDLTAMMREN
jgi:hypothetical protein